MIGYDLDGVIINDVVWDGDTSNQGIAKLHSLRENIQPTFIPSGEFVIITGRPEADREVTEKWLWRWKIFPRKIHMFEGILAEWSDSTAAEHKAKWINHYGIDMSCFVESEVKQVVKIRKLCKKAKILHFATEIGNMLAARRNEHESETELRNIYNNLFGDGGENR